MDDSILIGIVAVGLLGLGAALYSLERARRRRTLYRWAADNDYKLIAFDQPTLTEESSFPFTVSKAQQVFYISVLQKDGRTRSGWLLLGSGLLGLASAAAEVIWDRPGRVR